jgi:hypothetical protein
LDIHDNEQKLQIRNCAVVVLGVRLRRAKAGDPIVYKRGPKRDIRVFF